MSCKMSCHAHHQHLECGCMETRFPRPHGTRLCDLMNATDVSCMKHVFLKQQEGKLGCEDRCPPPCSEATYQYTISSSAWPSLAGQESEIKWLKKLNRPTENIRDNYLYLHIYFKELNYMLIEQKLTYELENFLSDIGGTMGMWIGISALTCAELLELVMRITQRLCQKLKAKTATTVKPF